MTARKSRSTKVAELDVNLEDLDDTSAEIAQDAMALEDDADDETPEPAPARKYFSHANCDHARKGEAGKAARAACRRAIRSYLAAEAEFLAEDSDVNVAV